MSKHSYVITEKCNSCGSCKVVCPKHCISKGFPYSIKENECISCGRCLTRCWRKAIVPKLSEL